MYLTIILWTCWFYIFIICIYYFYYFAFGSGLEIHRFFEVFGGHLHHYLGSTICMTSSSVVSLFPFLLFLIFYVDPWVFLIKYIIIYNVESFYLPSNFHYSLLITYWLIEIEYISIQEDVQIEQFKLRIIQPSLLQRTRYIVSV